MLADAGGHSMKNISAARKMPGDGVDAETGVVLEVCLKAGEVVRALVRHSYALFLVVSTQSVNSCAQVDEVEVGREE